MKIQLACTTIFDQLTDVLQQLHAEDFNSPLPLLSHASIGQHLRHTLEFFLCLEKGLNEGIINYDKREHDMVLENDKFLALACIQHIRSFICAQQEDKTLLLEVNYNILKDESVTIPTSFTRELIYNIEHALHHIAILKIGLRESAPYVVYDANFGIAASTIRHKDQKEKAVPKA